MENTQAVETKKDAFSKRIHELDFARGILMVLVIMDHIFNLLGKYLDSWGAKDVASFFNGYVNWGPRIFIRYICLALFVFLSGISSAFSKNNWKRAGKMLIFWLAIFIFSAMLEAGLQFEPFKNIQGLPSAFISINIIGVIGFSVLLYCPLQGKKWYWLLVAAIVSFLFHILLVLIKDTPYGEKLQPLALFFYPSGRMADFMPLVPYMGFFFLGAMFSEFTYCKKQDSYFKRYNWERPVCFLGRHSLIIYITHFFVLILIFSLIGLFVGK